MFSLYYFSFFYTRLTPRYSTRCLRLRLTPLRGVRRNTSRLFVAAVFFYLDTPCTFLRFARNYKVGVHHALQQAAVRGPLPPICEETKRRTSADEGGTKCLVLYHYELLQTKRTTFAGATVALATPPRSDEAPKAPHRRRADPCSASLSNVCAREAFGRWGRTCGSHMRGYDRTSTVRAPSAPIGIGGDSSWGLLFCDCLARVGPLMRLSRTLVRAARAGECSVWREPAIGLGIDKHDYLRWKFRGIFGTGLATQRCAAI